MINKLPYHEIINIMLQLISFSTVLHEIESNMAGELIIQQEVKSVCAVLVWADDFICSGTRTNFYRVGTFSCLLCSCINVISHAVRWLLEHAIRSVQKSKSIHIFCRGENVIFWKAECQQIWTEVEYFVSNNIRTYYIKLSIYFDFSMLWNC